MLLTGVGFGAAQGVFEHPLRCGDAEGGWSEGYLSVLVAKNMGIEVPATKK